MGEEETEEVPTFLVNANSIPEAHYKAIQTVWEKGMTKRTQYDRQDSRGNFIDPPSRDARIMVHITDPFAEPRFAALSFCERGAYALELMGAKDHRVLTPEEVKQGAAKDSLDTRWPYTYSKRLDEWPGQDGPIDQAADVLERLAQNIDTRRAVMSTRCPELDVLLREDLPCLGEIHFRALEKGEEVILDPLTTWRSRDLFKAWPDNVVGITYRLRQIAKLLGEKIDRPVRVGAYTDLSNSLHIYGQDFMAVEGDGGEKKGFFEVNPTVEDYVRKSMSSEDERVMNTLPQMKRLREDPSWEFPPERMAIIDREIQQIEEGQTP
jgi:thymidylate synthase